MKKKFRTEDNILSKEEKRINQIIQKNIQQTELENIRASKKEKRLNWIIRAYLYLLMFINGFALFEMFAMMQYQTEIPKLSGGILKTTLFILFANLISLSLLAKKMKIGFWAYCITSLISIGVSIHMGAELQKGLSAILGLLFLFGLLQLGGKNKAWNQLG